MGPALRSGYALPSVRPHRRSHPDCRWILILIVARHHGDIRAMLDAGVLDRTDDGRVIFPYDAVHVDFTLTKAA